MAGITIDLSNYKERSSARVPEGEYLVNVEDLEMTETRKGDPMLVVYLKIIGGDSDGLNLVDRLTLTEKAMFRAVGFLQGLGIKTPKRRIQVDPAKIVGRKVRVEVGDGDPYNGVVRSEIRSYIRVAKAATEETPDLEDVEETEEAEEQPKAKKAPAASPEDTTDSDEVDLDDLDI